MNSNTIIEAIKTYKAVAVIRAENQDKALELAHAIYAGGIRVLEITFTVLRADITIQHLIHDPKLKDALIGAGTVLDLKTAEIAVKSGAKFIVSPGFDKEVSLFCKHQDIPYLPGCLTLTEMIEAMKHGASMIKLFPANAFGPDYIKSIKGPLPHIQVMPTGGVNLNNIKEWFKAGAVAVGIGSDLTKPGLQGDYQGVTKLAKEYIHACQNV
jgi:2-dehydro-3-deoxyphosphogluconate aldolase/(4S)-4-hydroxy-2-oxoglutarate aldolase